MKVKGMTGLELSGVVADLNSRWYDGNIMAHITDTTRPTSRASYAHIKVGVYDSYGYGARHSWSGRHGPWACWHVFRDIIAEAYRQHGESLVWWTSFETYRSRTDFLDKFPGTADRNIGSMMQPTYMTELCGCLGGRESFPIPVREDRRTRQYENRIFPAEVVEMARMTWDQTLRRNGRPCVLRRSTLGSGVVCAECGTECECVVCLEQGALEMDHTEALESMAGVISMSYDQIEERYGYNRQNDRQALRHMPEVSQGLNDGHTHDPNRHLPPEFYDAEDEMKSWRELMDDMTRVREARKGMKR